MGGFVAGTLGTPMTEVSSAVSLNSRCLMKFGTELNRGEFGKIRETDIVQRRLSQKVFIPFWSVQANGFVSLVGSKFFSLSRRNTM